MESITVHVDEENYAVIYCPSCGSVKRVAVGRFKNVKHKLATRCPCGERFEVMLNFRRFYRKKVDMPGQFMLLSGTDNDWAAMTVCDISMRGLRVKLGYNAPVGVGDTLRVRFTLEGRKSATLDKKVIVRFRSGDILGCEFVGLNLEEKELGFFLFK